MSDSNCNPAPTTAIISHRKPTPTVANANITVATICTIPFVFMVVAKNAQKTNASVIINKNNIIMNVIEAEETVISLPFSFQFFTRLAAVFAEEVGDDEVFNHSPQSGFQFPFRSLLRMFRSLPVIWALKRATVSWWAGC